VSGRATPGATLFKDFRLFKDFYKTGLFNRKGNSLKWKFCHVLARVFRQEEENNARTEKAWLQVGEICD